MIKILEPQREISPFLVTLQVESSGNLQARRNTPYLSVSRPHETDERNQLNELGLGEVLAHDVELPLINCAVVCCKILGEADSQRHTQCCMPGIRWAAFGHAVIAPVALRQGSPNLFQQVRWKI